MSGYHELNRLEAQGENGELLLNNNENGMTGVRSTPPTMSQELLQATKAKDVQRLRQIIKNSNPKELELDHIYEEGFRALIHYAAENKSADAIKALLDGGASVNLTDIKKYTALHYAAKVCSPEAIQTLLDNGASVNMKESDFGRTCLHVLAFNWKSGNPDWDAALDKLLRVKNIRIDSGDEGGVTPIYLAAKKGWKYMVESLIYKGARLDTKVGSKTATDIINQKMPGLLDSIDWDKIEETKAYYDEELYEALKDQNLSRFKEILKEVNAKEKSSKLNYLEQDHGGYTLLSYACDNGLDEFVDVLLEEGVNPVKVYSTTRFTPLLYAAKHGYAKIVKLLTEAMQKSGTLAVGLNASDLKGETPLHKVVKRELPQDRRDVDYRKCLEILLSDKVVKNLKINAKDNNDSTPLHYAVLCDDQSFVLRLFKGGAHLNVKNKFGTLAISRIQPAILEEMLNDCVEGRNRMTDTDFEIILHYSLFVPTTPDYAQETDCLKFLSGSRPHRHLLRHPVIDTFLFLKWQRISRYYYANLIAYAVFLILLTTYICLFFGTVQKGFLGNNSSTLENLLPVSENETLSDHQTPAKVVLQVLIMLFWICGLFREIVQFLVSWKTYLKSPENWLEVSILFMTIILFFFPIPYTSQQGLSAWLILFSWAELVLILGRLPTLAVYITMFTTVTLNFLKFILMFSFIIFAFSLSFFLVFQIDDNFVTYPKTLLKTIAMSTGEIEYTDLPLTTFPVSSHLLFVIFVFIIVLVLMNLLNGLAVSDIQQIQQEAEILSYRSRIELIAYIESVFLPNSYEQQAKCGPLCGTDSCCFRTDVSSTKPPLGFLKFFGKRALMFRKCLKKESPCIQMYPNKSSNRWSVCSCHTFRLQESQIEAAKSVVIAGKGGVIERIAGLEDKVESVMKAIESLTDMVQSREIKISSAK